MKEKSAADELAKLAGFKETQNEWFLKEEKKKRSRKTTPKVQTEEGSSSQSKKKRQKKVVETLLVDEPDEDEQEADADIDQERLSFETEQFLKTLNDTAETEKATGEEGDDEGKSSSESKVDETVRWNKVMADKEKQKKRKRSGDDDDDVYIPSQEHVQDVQTPPSSRGRKKSNVRKSVVSPKEAKRLKIKLNKKAASKPQQPQLEPQSEP
ncbi:hypothetical protein Hdeb2414_s0002g00050741 [Helianthus debilis subsp. tardiflorus]